MRTLLIIICLFMFSNCSSKQSKRNNNPPKRKYVAVILRDETRKLWAIIELLGQGRRRLKADTDYLYVKGDTVEVEYTEGDKTAKVLRLIK